MHMWVEFPACAMITSSHVFLLEIHQEIIHTSRESQRFSLFLPEHTLSATASGYLHGSLAAEQGCCREGFCVLLSPLQDAVSELPQPGSLLLEFSIPFTV